MLRILSISVALALALFCGACAKKRAPDPPKSRMQLTIVLFEALDAGDHKTALVKIEKLREIDPANIFLAKLQKHENTRVLLTDVQVLLDDGDLPGAEHALARIIDRQGKSKLYQEAKDELSIIKAVDLIVRSANNPSSHVSLAKDIVRLRKISRAYKEAEILEPFIKEKTALAYEMEKKGGVIASPRQTAPSASKTDRSRAVFGLCSDIRILLEERNPKVLTLVAELEVESPGHPIIRKFFNGRQ